MRFSPPYVLALDLGTTGCKGILVDSEGFLVDRMTAKYPSITFKSGHMEQNPLLWFKSVKEIIVQLLRKIDLNDLAGLGFCGTMAAALPVDKSGNPLRNALLYADMRGADQAKKLAREFNSKDVYALTGNPISPVYSLSKWMWIKENEPKIFEKTFKFIQPKDFFVLKLTGEITTDFVDASATMAFDVTKRKWVNEILSFCDIPLEKLPEPQLSINIAGELTSKSARESGLKKGLPVIVGCGDTAALLAGSKAVDPEHGTIYLGAAAEIDLTTEKPIYNAKAMVPVRCHAIPDMWFNSASAMTSGTALKWFSKQFGRESYREIDKKANAIPAGSGGLIFLPYLSGERMPIWDPLARGAFIGIAMSSSRVHFYRAVLEGVAFSLKSIMDVYRDMNVHFKKISISGGGAKSILWKQIIVDVLGLKCYELEQPEEASALGVALYVNMALGNKKITLDMRNKFVKTKGLLIPDKKKTNVYKKFYRIYRKCYPALAEIMHSLARGSFDYDQN
ncbi:MAG: xylulokinase [Candidatus Bathyarchaeia archaeon]